MNAPYQVLKHADDDLANNGSQAAQMRNSVNNHGLRQKLQVNHIEALAIFCAV
jgi:hypothetical protein